MHTDDDEDHVSHLHTRWDLTQVGDEMHIWVVDRRPGIEPGDLPRLFTRFGKLDHTPRAGHVGTGLGLFISKTLVEAMRGRIVLSSRPGRGSVCRVTLPLAREKEVNVPSF